MFKKEEYITYKLEVHGMRCGMCESHINDILRRSFDIKKVKSNHKKNLTIIQTIHELDLDKLKDVIQSLGYEVKSIEKQ
jgi:copper chaperone CopZ